MLKKSKAINELHKLITDIQTSLDDLKSEVEISLEIKEHQKTDEVIKKIKEFNKAILYNRIILVDKKYI